jgi:2-polyprenyl-3-methyl-5-hydroxy-6-metoxy-1,4-benzoquinol methylase
MSTDAPSELDDDAIRLMAFRVWGYKQGEQVSLLIHLGDRLGLFRALAGAGPVTSDELAERAGLDPRWVREWVWAMAAAELVEHDPGGGTDRFELTRAGKAVLVDEDSSLFFAAGAFSTPPPPDLVDDYAECFRTGVGLPYDRLGPNGAHRTERMLGPWARLALVPVVLPMLDGIVDRLEAGADVCDVGCGSGVALEAMARAYPASRFTGYDPSRHAVERARVKMADAGLDNVEIVHARAEDLPSEPSYDLVLTFDCLHDMTHPDEALRAVRRSLRDDGTLLVKEIRCADTLEQNRANPMLAMMLGFSITSCMSSATSEPGGMGLGTVGLPASRLQALAAEAGFSRFRSHDPGEPSNVYYELRP